MKKSCYTLGSFVCLWWLVTVTVFTVHCQPIRKAWALETVGTCINMEVFPIAIAVPNVITDAGILILPIYQISRLHLKWTQKITISGIFVLGGL